MPKLFSYGTLQQEDVQLATFGRRLTGVSDALVGYRQSMVAIQDPEVVRTSGKTHHPIVAFTGKNEDRVAGALFEISDAELAHADAYEVAAYVRVKAPLASGLEARGGSMSMPAASLQRREPWTRATRSQPTPSRVMPANAGIQSVTDET
jgi:Gamma-glutamyl cyclotransferase, AIG2-like